jgi:hypothetical protein
VLMDKLAVEEKTLREIERALKKDETTKWSLTCKQKKTLLLLHMSGVRLRWFVENPRKISIVILSGNC